MLMVLIGWNEPFLFMQRYFCLQMPFVQEGLFGQFHPHQAPANTQRREAISVQIVFAQVSLALPRSLGISTNPCYVFDSFCILCVNVYGYLCVRTLRAFV